LEPFSSFCFFMFFFLNHGSRRLLSPQTTFASLSPRGHSSLLLVPFSRALKPPARTSFAASLSGPRLQCISKHNTSSHPWFFFFLTTICVPPCVLL
jgi:hypothetical protein